MCNGPALLFDLPWHVGGTQISYLFCMRAFVSKSALLHTRTPLGHCSAVVRCIRAPPVAGARVCYRSALLAGQPCHVGGRQTSYSFRMRAAVSKSAVLHAHTPHGLRAAQRARRIAISGPMARRRRPAAPMGASHRQSPWHADNTFSPHEMHSRQACFELLLCWTYP